MYKLDIPQDPKQAAKIAAMRQREEARRVRVMNPRAMKMGMDFDHLSMQVQQRKDQEAMEQERELMISDQMNKHDRLLQMMERRQKSDALALNRAVVEYRREHQKPEQRREFDLNDPDALRNEAAAPVRTGDEEDDARFGPASMQYFEGEDNHATARADLQKQQMREWVKHAEAEHAEQRAAAKAEKEMSDQVLLAQAKHTGHLMDETAKWRHEQYMAARAENAKLMAEQAAAKMGAAEAEQLADYRDVMTSVTSQMLDDTPESGYDRYGRIAHTKHFRGFMPGQLAAIRAEQEVQKVEMAERRRQEQITEAEYQQQEAAHARLVHLAERQAARDAKAAAQQLNAENTIVGGTRAAHCIGVNAVKADFFGQFGTGSR